MHATLRGKLLHSRGDDFWDALSVELDEVALPVEIRDLLGRETIFNQAMEAWRAGGASEKAKAMVFLRGIARPLLELAHGSRTADWLTENATPPAWWRAYSRSVFSLFREEQLLALSLVGVKQPVAVPELERLIQARRTTERLAGDLLHLHYPVASRLGHTAVPVYGGQEETVDPAKVYQVEAELDACLSPILENMQPEDRSRSMRSLIEQLSELLGVVDTRQNLARIATLQDDIARETGCTEWEVTAFLLCDTTPDLPFVRVETLSESHLAHRPIGDGPVRLIIGSPRVPVAAVASAFSDLLARLGTSTSDGRRSRSASPILAADFVRDYRQRAAKGGRSPSWSEMWDAFHALNPDAYTSLQSFRQTVYRHLGPSRKSGQS